MHKTPNTTQLNSNVITYQKEVVYLEFQPKGPRFYSNCVSNMVRGGSKCFLELKDTNFIIEEVWNYILKSDIFHLPTRYSQWSNLAAQKYAYTNMYIIHLPFEL